MRVLLLYLLRLAACQVTGGQENGYEIERALRRSPKSKSPNSLKLEPKQADELVE